MPIYGTEMTVWTRHLAYMRVNGDGMRPKLRPDELVVVNMAIQTLSDGWNLLSIHGRQLGAKGKSPALRFPATITSNLHR
jgi:phage repressor protein C with HTH and peptisase S24 domain